MLCTQGVTGCASGVAPCLSDLTSMACPSGCVLMADSGHAHGLPHGWVSGGTGSWPASSATFLPLPTPRLSAVSWHQAQRLSWWGTHTEEALGSESRTLLTPAGQVCSVGLAKTQAAKHKIARRGHVKHGSKGPNFQEDQEKKKKNCEPGGS